MSWINGMLAGCLCVLVGFFLGKTEQAISLSISYDETSECALTWQHPTADETGVIRMYVCDEN